MKKAAHGYLWNVTGEHVTVERLQGKAERMKNKRGGHVMISYNWCQQQIVVQLNQELQKSGIPTWMDVDQMSKNVNSFLALKSIFPFSSLNGFSFRAITSASERYSY